MSVVFACHSRYKLISIVGIGAITSLILALRFEYLPWGDPWFEYGMIQRILVYHTIDPAVYSSQLPVMHLVIVTISLFSATDPLLLLKFLIPLLSIIGVVAVYQITKEISSAEIACFAALLVLCGTPWMHWTTQGVRESLGLALLILLLYTSFRAVRSHDKSSLIITILLACGLVLTHDLSFMLFLFIWIAMSLTYLFFVCEISRIRISALFTLVIIVAAVVFMELWSFGKAIYGYTEVNTLLNTFSHSSFGIIVFIGGLTLLYLIPVTYPEKIRALRSGEKWILSKRNVIYVLLVGAALAGSGIALNFIMGNALFVLSYPLPMLFNGVCMIFLSLIGLYFFLETDRIPFLSWAAVLVLFLILSMIGFISFVDPLRFLEFLSIPLAIIAAFGVDYLYRHLKMPSLFPIILAVFVVISVVTAFPALVFFGETFSPSHPLYDSRSIVIEHNPSEIAAISWMNTSLSSGVIRTDTYAGYAARGIIISDTIVVEKSNPFTHLNISERGAEKPQYLLILSRMTEYMEFGSQWQKEKKALDPVDLERISQKNNLLYNNGNVKIYSPPW